MTEINLALDLLWRNDIPPEKVVLGLGFYGRSFTLTDPACSKPGCTFSSGARPGICTGNEGTLSFAEIRDVFESADNVTVTVDEPAAVEMVVFGSDQWVSYDAEQTFRMKYEYANGKCLGGLMVWAVSQDNIEGQAQEELCAAIGCTVRRAAVEPVEVVCAATTNCDYYHTVIEGDTCYGLYIAVGLSMEDLMALNPGLEQDCSNLKLGYRYLSSQTLHIVKSLSYFRYVPRASPRQSEALVISETFFILCTRMGTEVPPERV